MSVYTRIQQSKTDRKKQLGVLIDPDSTHRESLLKTLSHCNAAGADIILAGGSLMTNGFWEESIRIIKSETDIPVVLFPGDVMQVHEQADALLFLSLISGRNPDLLIGKHVQAAPGLRMSGIEVIPTGYMIVDGGGLTSVMYMSNTMPIPHDKDKIAGITAMAGEMLGLKLIYMDAGSGAKNPISEKMIREVCASVSVPIIVGGGIRSAAEAADKARAGADVVVVGNAFEKHPELIREMVEAVHAV